MQFRQKVFKFVSNYNNEYSQSKYFLFFIHGYGYDANAYAHEQITLYLCTCAFR